MITEDKPNKDIQKKQRDGKEFYVYTLMYGAGSALYYQNKTSQHMYEDLKLNLVNLEVVDFKLVKGLLQIHIPPKQNLLIKLKKVNPRENC